MKNPYLRLAVTAILLVIVVGSTRRTEAKFYTAYILDC